MNQCMKRELKEEVCKKIALFSAQVLFHCVKNLEFAKMLKLVGKYGVGLKPPSYHEIRGKYLIKEVLRVNDMLEDCRLEWKKTGFSIKSDG